MHEPIIFEATEAKAEYLESINILLPQLSQSARHVWLPTPCINR